MPKLPREGTPVTGEARQVILRDARGELVRRGGNDFEPQMILFAMVCLHLLGQNRLFTLNSFKTQLASLSNMPPDASLSSQLDSVGRPVLDPDPEEWGGLASHARDFQTINDALGMAGEESTFLSRLSTIINQALLAPACAGVWPEGGRVTARKKKIKQYRSERQADLHESEKEGVYYAFDLCYYNTSTPKSPPRPKRPAPLSDPPGPTAAAVVAYLRVLIERREQCPWLVSRTLDLRAEIVGHGSVLAREWLGNWMDQRQPSTCFLVGDWGSGKTGLARWVAAELASRFEDAARGGVMPLMLNMELARYGKIKCPADVLKLTNNATQSPEILAGGRTKQLLVILDGLDELIDPSNPHPALYDEVIESICRWMPPTANFLVTCRDPVFDIVSPILREIFARKDGRVGDGTKAMVSAVLGRHPASEPVELRMCPLDLSVAEGYFRGTPSEERWTHFKDDPAYQDFARRPLTLLLLDETLFSKENPDPWITLATLYERSIQLRLRKVFETRWDKPKAIDRANGLIDRLEGIVADKLHEGRSPDERKEFLQTKRGDLSPSIPTGEDRDALVKSGLLRQPGERLVLAHYTYVEFLIARRLFRELAENDSHTLRRLNLLGAYGINRFLVPLLNAEIGPRVPSPGGARKITVVTNELYNRFLVETHWRRARSDGEGVYGIRPEAHIYYGRSSAYSQQIQRLLREHPPESCPDLEANAAAPVAGVSWYDAFQFCRWFGQSNPGSRLLIAQDIEGLSLPDTPGLDCLWCGEWFDEPKSHMQVVTSGGAERGVGGVNPDFRLPRVGFCVSHLGGQK